MSKLSDEWETPQWLFDELNNEFNFDIDLCATGNNNKCDVFFRDYLTGYCSNYKYNSHSIWDIETYVKVNKIKCCFMNPPYSNPLPFIKKAWEDSRHCKIVCLLKVDPSTKWWAVFWDYTTHYPKFDCEVRFLPKRVKFERWGIDKKGGRSGISIESSATFPSCIVIMDRRK